ncbi:sensor histidine kinase [Mobilicoccus caccae]|nr:histidine kinase [Mobilicoccus caccae]
MTTWLCIVIVPTAMATRWMIDVVRRLWRSRQVAADLAVAEERLRFSRDLHDVFGRTLSTVAVKSELAAELARRGDDRAAEEMMAVREIAQSALTDVRGLVRGYRRIQLDDEVIGARSVLRAAGIRTRVLGLDDPEAVAARLSDPAAEALAWVVREGVTNVLRHGQAGEVRITVDEAPDHVVLTIENTSLNAVTRTPGGTGLIGLRERVEAVGGSLEAGPSESGFALVAGVPLH